MAAIKSRFVAIGIALLACAAIPCVADETPVQVLRRVVVTEDVLPIAGIVSETHLMRLHLAVMSETGWESYAILEAAKRAAGILAQCAIRTSIELFEFNGPVRYRSLFTPVSRDLAKRLALPTPTIFFIADTLERPAFDAEAIGRGNSRTRPELADTVWIASGARDLPIVIAHELVHVLTDSGTHSDQPGNLMRDETAQDNARLAPKQCDAIVTTASANGLLQPLR